MAMWGLCLVSLATAVLAQTQIILDDMDQTLTTTSKNTYEGTFEPCMRDAFGGQFHHDWSRNKGDAYFKFTFEVPQNGCYSLEEHHPGADAACSRYLPSNARLDIDWCKGGKTTMYMDQSTKGGQWNYLGIFPFYVGWEGHLNVSTSADEKCSTGNCFMMVDAFRLTRVADYCSQDVEKRLKEFVREEQEQQQEQEQEQQQEQEQEQDDASSSSSWQIGSLRLTVKADTADLLGELRAHSSVLEATLETQLGAISVKVEEITSLAAERRRLQSIAAFDVKFKAQLPSSTGLEEAEVLPADLSSAFAAAGSELQIQAAELTWAPVKESNEKDEESNGKDKENVGDPDDAGSDLETQAAELIEAPVIEAKGKDKDSNSCLFMVGVVAASLIGLVTMAVLAQCFYKKYIRKPITVDGQEVNKEPDLEKDCKEEKDVQDVDDNASTMSPTSVHSTES